MLMSLASGWLTSSMQLGSILGKQKAQTHQIRTFLVFREYLLPKMGNKVITKHPQAEVIETPKRVII